MFGNLLESGASFTAWTQRAINGQKAK